MQNKRALKWLGVFFAVMILLTALSRAADTLTIAEVTAERAKSGALTHTAVGRGSMEGKSQRLIYAVENLPVRALLYQKGAKVRAGDAIIELDAQGIEAALEKLQAELDKLLGERAQAALEEREAEAAQTPGAQAELAQAQAAVERAQGELERAQATAAEQAQKKLDEARAALEDAQAELDKAVREASRAVEDAQAALDGAKDEEKKAAQDKLQRAKDDLLLARKEAERKVNTADAAAGEARRAQDALAADPARDEGARAAQSALIERQEALSAAERKLQEAQDADERAAKARESAQKQARLKLEALQIDIERKWAEVDALKQLQADGGLLRAPADGTIAALSCEAGKRTTDEAAAALFDEAAGLTVQISLTEEQARFVSPGDAAQLTPAGKREAVSGSVAAVLQTAEGAQAVIEAEAGQGLAVGASVEVALSRKTDSYRQCLPLSALHSDSSGDFVLVIRERNGVLGMSMTAQRVPVEVLDEDGSRAAVSGALMEEDLVIIESDKEIGTGDRVRLVES